MSVSPFLHAESSSDSPSTQSVTTIRVGCELDRSSEAEVLRELLPRVQSGAVVLDLSRVDWMDAAGIAALITLYCQATQFGHSFSIISPSAHVLELLHIVGLDKILIGSPQAA